MKLTSILFAAMALVPSVVVADFDMWESNTIYLSSGCTDCGPIPIDEVKIMQPYINFDEALRKSHSIGWGAQPWCNKGIKFSNGCAVLKNCGGGGSPHKVSNGAKFADLEDCGGGNRGTCYAWHEQMLTTRLDSRESRRVTYSRIACKTSFFKGENAIGAW